nr:hypothetical protein [Lachnospiraceae bacterium]
RALRLLLHLELPEAFAVKAPSGSGLPIGAYLNGPLKQQLLDMCSGTLLSNQGIFDAAFVKETAYEYLKQRTPDGHGPGPVETILWNYYVFQQWYEEYFEN